MHAISDLRSVDYHENRVFSLFDSFRFFKPSRQITDFVKSMLVKAALISHYLQLQDPCSTVYVNSRSHISQAAIWLYVNH